jgi:hypothetical protein
VDLQQAGKWLLGLGVLIVVAGAVVYGLGAAGVKLPLGRLPGDISYRRGNTRVFFPVATMLLVSVVLTIVLNLLLRRGR